jgi:tRNA 2-thiouridine synthesizing protein A
MELVKRRVLDLRGYVCPYPQLATLKALRSMGPGEVLEVLTDNPPSVQNVPAIARREGHEVLGVEQAGENLWRIVIRRSG